MLIKKNCIEKIYVLILAKDLHFLYLIVTGMEFVVNLVMVLMKCTMITN